MTKKKKILLLGATGSIGSQTLDVVRQHPDLFEVSAVSAGHSLDKLEDIVKEFDTIEMAGICADTDKTNIGKARLISGADQMARLVKEADYDLLVNAVVGFRGLEPTLLAIERGKDIALANKESLVCGGELVKKALAASDVTLTPIDSEHSAIYQALAGNDKKDIDELIITASGGSLRNLSRKDLENITPAQALNHPNWDMGARITIDSATMVNKGFEVIEAHYLFDVDYDSIRTVLHPQSIVHSMIRYKDNSIMAQLGSPDMRLPIQYAITQGERPELKEDHPLSFEEALSLDFKPMDHERYPILDVIIQAGKDKGNRGCVANGADEMAVQLFLEGKIPFLEIENAIKAALDEIDQIEEPTLAQLIESDTKARDFVKKRYL